MGRAPCCEKVGLKKGRWTEEEDEALRRYILENGEGSWRSLPKNAGLLRCGKSCRLRWINYLRDDLKRGNISSAEEEVIINLHSSLGNRWSLIASHLPGRTDNEIKNYWNSHLSRKIHSYRRPAATNTHLAPAEIAQTAPVQKRKGGRNARWAMKKNRNLIPVKNHRNGDTSVDKTKEIVNVAVNEAVPLPSTPELENEVMSSTTTVEDWMVLEPSAFHDVTGEAENSIMNSMLHREVGEEEKVTEDKIFLGPQSSDMFCVYGILENEPSEADAVRVINSDPDSGNKVVSREAVNSDSNTNRNTEGVDWDWESVVQGEDVWEDKNNQSMLSWLLDDDNNVETDTQPDIVSWLLS